jgi:hypothetical protein
MQDTTTSSSTYSIMIQRIVLRTVFDRFIMAIKYLPRLMLGCSMACFQILQGTCNKRGIPNDHRELP